MCRVGWYDYKVTQERVYKFAEDHNSAANQTCTIESAVHAYVSYFIFPLKGFQPRFIDDPSDTVCGYCHLPQIGTRKNLSG